MMRKYTKQMKANKVKQAVKSANVAIVNEPATIDQMFKRNALGYMESSDAGALSVEDSVGYVVSKLESGQSAIRDAILLCGYIFKTRTADVSKKFEESLKSRWSGSTLPNMISISKQLEAFEKSGLDINEVNDVYGLREVSKLIKDEKTSGEAIKLLNAGESPRKVKATLAPKAKVEEKSEDNAEESESLENKTAIQAAIILTAVDRFAILADNETRLRLTRQIVSKMQLGNVILGHIDAINAVHALKANK